ncbi:MAG: C-24(28) sterol reductase [Caeruleum heppii]|nr:MAG: C-24(28) sterol reductase [Caeruleum heppii]
MTITTRSQTGKTPRKTPHPGFVETPATRSSRPRRSHTPTSTSDDASSSAVEDASPSAPSGDTIRVDSTPTATRRKASTRRRKTDATASNGTVPRIARGKKVVDGWEEGKDPRVDYSGHFEFGGSVGVTVMMIGFPLLMYYMWLGATYYDGHLPLPAKGQTVGDFGRQMWRQVYEGAHPSLKAWTIYWTFFLFEAACYILLPGVTAKGKPLPHEGGRQLTYHCSGVWSFYTTIAVAGILHGTGLFPLYTLIDEFGPLMSVAIISGFLVSIVAYFSALQRHATHRMSGYPVYDFFMGAELNPRMFGILDFKMFFEVRLPWYILFLVSLGAAARQYEQFGWVSGEIGFLLLAHYLYANACSKGEELIVTTWDMYFEKWGFMLIFWNLAGVPLSYCHATIYLANHAPHVYRWPRPLLVALYVAYLLVYWIWDTSNSQKNRFRAEERGGAVIRNTFPQLPWQTVSNPARIQTETGDSLLVDGWYKYARKIHYTCDLFFALSWAGITGFSSPFPWFYPLFFSVMIAHRALRDLQRCRVKYGAAWEVYERRVPWVFVPYVY